MTLAEVDLLSKAMAPVVMELIEKAVTTAISAERVKFAALEMRILDLETKPAVIGPQGERGEKGLTGEKGDPGNDGLRGATGEVGAPGIPGPPGADGKDGAPGPKGENGKDAPPVDTEAIVQAVLSRLPAPEKGDRGEPGPAGKDAPEVNVEALASRVASMVPLPKDGAPGTPGKDGVGVMDAVQDRQGHLVLTLSDGRTKDVGLIAGEAGPPGLNGKDGANGLDGKDGRDGINGKDGMNGLNGKDGMDGLAFEKAEVVEHEDGWAWKLAAGNREEILPAPILHYRGVWEAGKTYPPGASVTWDGQIFIAKVKTFNVPSEGSDWTLALRRGKQGKEGKPGPQGPEGREGKQGPKGERGPKGDPVGV